MSVIGYLLTPTVAITGTGNVASFAITAVDNSSGVKQVTVRLQSPSGQKIKALASQDPATLMYYLNFDSEAFSYYAEAGIWKVSELELTDAAGNSRILGTADFIKRQFPTDVEVISPNSYIAAADLLDFVILTPEVFPASGSARMSFAVSALDDVSGIEKIRIDLQGPNGQYLAAWGYYFDTTPLSASAQIDTAILSTLLQEGEWLITEIEVFDLAGNSSRSNSEQLSNNGYPSSVTVSY